MKSKLLSKTLRNQQVLNRLTDFLFMIIELLNCTDNHDKFEINMTIPTTMI